MSREGRRRWDIGSRFVIGRPGNPMLERIRLLQTPWFGLYLHRIHREDLDHVPHDHPWHFRSLVLRGGYTELFSPYPHIHPDIDRHLRTWRRWSRHRFTKDQAHRIVFVEPRTLTLVLVGRKHGSWGFFDTTGGWTDYRDALGLRPIEGVSG